LQPIESSGPSNDDLLDSLIAGFEVYSESGDLSYIYEHMITYYTSVLPYEYDALSLTISDEYTELAEEYQ
jgi:hypothetical protein